jgi:hypothetical protein
MNCPKPRVLRGAPVRDLTPGCCSKYCAIKADEDREKFYNKVLVQMMDLDETWTDSAMIRDPDNSSSDAGTNDSTGYLLCRKPIKLDASSEDICKPVLEGHPALQQPDGSQHQELVPMDRAPA